MEHTIPLRGTDFTVSPIAFGTVNAGLKWDGKDADNIINHYVDNGGNLIDSARVYFDWVKPEVGRSERVIGDWLRRCGRRSEVVIMTKGGHPPIDDMKHSRMSQEDMEHDIALSLRSLGIEQIDIYFYHRDDVRLPVAELIERMEGFRKKGMIRYYGCSNWSTARMAEAGEYAAEHGLDGFIANQNLYNIAAKYMKPFDDETMETLDEAAIELFRHTNNTPMPYFGNCSAFFHRLASKGESAVVDSCYYTPKNLEVAKRIDSLCNKYGCTITQVLMGFFFTLDYDIIPLVGSSNIAQLDDLLGSVDIPFVKEDFDFSNI